MFFSVWFGQDFLDDHKYAIEGPEIVRNLTDFTSQFKKKYEESDIVDKFEEIFLPRSNVSVYEPINVIFILRSLYSKKKFRELLRNQG